MDDRRFLNDFKKWMSNQKFEFNTSLPKKSKLVGRFVESKISAKKLAEKITVIEGDDDDIVELSKEFRSNGGTVVEVYQDDMILIETDSGKFTLHKFFIKKERDDLQ